MTTGKSALLLERLGRLGLLRCFTHCGETSLRLFQTLRRSCGGRNQFFHVPENAGVLRLLSQLFDKWLNLSVKNKHLTGKTGLQKEFSIERAMQHKGSSHLPVSARLT